MSKTDQKNLVGTLIGVGLGALTVYAVKKNVDVQYPSMTIMKDTLKGFAYPSAYGGVGFGVVGAAVEANKAKKKELNSNDNVIVAFSAGLIGSGIVSGLMPVVSPAPAASMRYVPQQQMLPRQITPVIQNGGYVQPARIERGSV